MIPIIDCEGRRACISPSGLILLPKSLLDILDEMKTLQDYFLKFDELEKDPADGNCSLL
jgi:hypothetical protein